METGTSTTVNCAVDGCNRDHVGVVTMPAHMAALKADRPRDQQCGANGLPMLRHFFIRFSRLIHVVIGCVRPRLDVPDAVPFTSSFPFSTVHWSAGLIAEHRQPHDADCDRSVD